MPHTLQEIERVVRSTRRTLAEIDTGNPLFETCDILCDIIERYATETREQAAQIESLERQRDESLRGFRECRIGPFDYQTIKSDIDRLTRERDEARAERDKAKSIVSFLP